MKRTIVLKKVQRNLFLKSILIRPACNDDLFIMTDLLAALFTMEKDFTANLHHQREGLAALMADLNSTVLVAISNGKIIAMCTMQALISTAEGGMVGMVEDLVVDEKFRSLGVGSLLIQKIESIAKEKGMSRLQLLTDKGTEMEKFFTACEWQSTQLVAKRKLVS
ncbi:MAG: GNAT family N-acetyltransferase [Mariprofundaceae bacterium]